MADRVITAEALITAKDQTGDAMLQIAKKFEAIGKSAKISPTIDAMSKSIEKAQAQMKALDKFQSSQSVFADARAKFNAQKIAVEQAAKAMQQAAAPTKQLAASYAAAQKAVSQASAAFDKQKSAVVSAKQALEGFGIPVGKISAEQARLRGVLDATTRAIEHQAVAERHAAQAHAIAEKAQERRAEGIRHHGIMRYAAGAAAGAVGAHSIVHLVSRGIEAGAERQHARVLAKNAGIGDEERARIETSAIAARAGAPNLSTTEIMELHKEARSAVQHPEEAFHLIPDLAKAGSILKGMGVQDANLADIVKGGESLGLMNDPRRFHKYLEGQVKAMAVMGKTITTEQVYEAAKYSKASGSTLSDDFLNLTMPSLIQEMKGSSAGDALAMTTKTLRGGLQHKHLPVERLNELGLLEDPSKIRRNKAGTIMGYAGKVKDDELLATDPGKWFQTTFKNAAVEHGYQSLVDINKLLSETLPSTAANLGRILIQQEESLAQHRRNYEAAPGLDQASTNQNQDPKAGVMAMKAAMDDLYAAVTGPSMSGAAAGLHGLASAIRTVSEAATVHPVAATVAGGAAATVATAGAGYMAYSLANGFGLRPAASELMVAATMLKGAAGHSSLPGGFPGGPGGGGPGGGPGGKLGLGGRVLAYMFPLLDLALNAPPPNVAPPLEKHIDRFNRWWDENTYSWVPGNRGQIGPYGMTPNFRQPTMDEARQQQDLRAAYDRSRPSPYGALGAFDYGAGPQMSSNGIPMPIRRPAGLENMPGPMSPVEVHSTIDTNAVVKVEVTASEGLLARQTFQSVVSKPGVGPSMPQAAAGTPAAQAPAH